MEIRRLTYGTAHAVFDLMLSVVPSPTGEPLARASDGRRVRGRTAAAWIAAGLLITGGAWWSAESERRSVRRLEATTRAALLVRTLTDLHSACERDTPPTDWCRKQAEFVLLFEECDPACQATAREVLRTPTR